MKRLMFISYTTFLLACVFALGQGCERRTYRDGWNNGYCWGYVQGRFEERNGFTAKHNSEECLDSKKQYERSK